MSGHWGGDCPEIPAKSRPHYDVFSAKEATKYIDENASTVNLLTESANSCKRGQQEQGRADGSMTIKGAANNNSYQGGYNQQPSEQAISSIPKKPKKRHNLSTLLTPEAAITQNFQPYNVYSAPNTAPQPSSRPWDAQADLALDNTPPSPYISYTPNTPYASHPPHTPIMAPPTQNYSLTLPVRSNPNRGNDAYVAYRGNPSNNQYRPRSRSPPGRNGGYRQRDNYYNAPAYDQFAPQPQGHYDSSGAFHYQGPGASRQYNRGGGGSSQAPPPPPPPAQDYGADYGRRQTFHAVPPPPPEPRGRYNGGGRRY